MWKPCGIVWLNMASICCHDILAMSMHIYIYMYIYMYIYIYIRIHMNGGPIYVCNMFLCVLIKTESIETPDFDPCFWVGCEPSKGLQGTQHPRLQLISN